MNISELDAKIDKAREAYIQASIEYAMARMEAALVKHNLKPKKPWKELYEGMCDSYTRQREKLQALEAENARLKGE